MNNEYTFQKIYQLSFDFFKNNFVQIVKLLILPMLVMYFALILLFSVVLSINVPNLLGIWFNNTFDAFLSAVFGLIILFLAFWYTKVPIAKNTAAKPKHHKNSV